MALQMASTAQIARRTPRKSSVAAQAYYCGPSYRRFYRKNCGPTGMGFKSSVAIDPKAIDDFLNAFFGDVSYQKAEGDSTRWFPVQGKRTESSYIIRAELPGVAKEDVVVKANKKRQLKIAYERKAAEDKEGETAAFDESRVGQYERVLKLPEDADVEGLSAKVENGLLTVTVPRNKDEAEEFIDVEVV